MTPPLQYSVALRPGKARQIRFEGSGGICGLVASLFCFVAPVIPAQQAGEFRQWTSTDGKKVEAAMAGMDGEAVKLKLRTGAVVIVPLVRLSSDDQAFARQAPAPAAGKAAPEKTWPRTVAVADISPVTVVKEDTGKKEFIYRSEHYEFHCDSKLGANVVREFNRMFEATYLLNCKLPLDLKPAPEPGQDYFVAKLHTTTADYLANGGIPGSAGSYDTSLKALSVPLSSLGVKMVGSRVTVEKSKEENNATLIHEITHQMMNRWLPQLPMWYIEGSAGYMEILKYDRGRFNLANPDNLLRTNLQRRGGEGKRFSMLDLEELAGLDDKTWEAAIKSKNMQAAQNYTSAMLLTFYFYHLDDKGDAAHMIDYLKALEKADGGKEGQQAAFKQHLLRERSFEALKTDVKKGLHKEGVEIDYTAPGRNRPPSTTATQ